MQSSDKKLALISKFQCNYLCKTILLTCTLTTISTKTDKKDEVKLRLNNQNIIILEINLFYSKALSSKQFLLC